jgi:hypothetical protein
MIMTVSTRWKTLAASGESMFSSWFRNTRQSEKRKHKRDLQQWENEGGNLAPAPVAPGTRDTTGSA